ncbi:hypothetical protein F0562_029829 [Nyssa sinensis]|uniref:Uncharacterized protein n=1 Tax=Nyssa sinensis TaxID=561372 RepID=A0A5J5AWB8_9ASTE|nr:hypothetical protein F0562_029829 [Nyssa sinensis]
MGSLNLSTPEQLPGAGGMGNQEVQCCHLLSFVAGPQITIRAGLQSLLQNGSSTTSGGLESLVRGHDEDRPLTHRSLDDLIPVIRELRTQMVMDCCLL